MNIKVSNDIGKSKLINFIMKIEKYDNFDFNQIIRCFVSGDELIAFESVKYNISFVLFSHKFIELKNCSMVEIPFVEFSRAIKDF